VKTRVSIVTGASSGIGRAIAEQFLSKGYAVIGNARSRDRLTDLEAWSKEAPGTFIPVTGDITDENTVTTLLDVCRNKFDVLPCIGVVNAGRGLSGSFTSSDPSKWEEMINLNILGAFRQFRMLAEAMTSNDAQDTDAPPPVTLWLLGLPLGPMFLLPILFMAQRSLPFMGQQKRLDESWVRLAYV